jgi:hypothetical protein
MATILVIGGQGVLGAITAEVLRARGSHRVLIGGRRVESREDFRYVDVGDPESIRAALAGIDVAVSTVADPQFELERVVVEAGARSINISSEVLPIGGHVSLKGSGLALVHAGLAPLGLQALIAKDLLRKHPDAARVEVAMIFSASGASGPQGKEFAYRALTRLPFEPNRVIAFPPPVGSRSCFSAALPDRDVLAALAPDLEAGVYIGFGEPMMHRVIVALRASRLIRILPRALFVGSGGPSKAVAATDEPVRQWVAVYDGSGKRLGATVTEGVGDYRTTALCALAFVEALLERLKTRKPIGTQSVERLFTLDDLRPHLPAEVVIRDVD